MRGRRRVEPRVQPDLGHARSRAKRVHGIEHAIGNASPFATRNPVDWKRLPVGSDSGSRRRATGEKPETHDRQREDTHISRPLVVRSAGVIEMSAKEGNKPVDRSSASDRENLSSTAGSNDGIREIPKPEARTDFQSAPAAAPHPFANHAIRTCNRSGRNLGDMPARHSSTLAGPGDFPLAPFLFRARNRTQQASRRKTDSSRASPADYSR